MRRRWLSPRAIRLHVVILIVVPSFAALCIWQIHRALDGNQLSWAYVFEWPFFAGYAVYMWWRFVHETPSEPDPPLAGAPVGEPGPETAQPVPPTGRASTGGPAAAAKPTPAAAGDDESERAAYNRYLSELALRGRRKQWR